MIMYEEELKSNTDKFLWGVVNIGAQTEGENGSSDWFMWAKRGLVPSIGNANEYDKYYKNDHDLVEELGCNSIRISIEWSHVEPKEGIYDESVLKHYRLVLADLKKRNITTVVGLWHWSLPAWYATKHGVHDHCFVNYFERFARNVCEELGYLIDHVVILNEPAVYIRESYMNGTRPPFFRDMYKAFLVAHNLVVAHKRIYVLWKGKYPMTMVGSTHLWNYEIGTQCSVLQKLYISAKRFFAVTFFVHRTLSCSDYIGINYYTSNRLFFGYSGNRWGVHGTNNWHDPDVWRQFPQGIYHVLMYVQKYQKPIYILENGKPTEKGINDVDRTVFIEQTIAHMQNAIKKGVDVRGYFHYCLCDSYEWDSGYDCLFGIVAIDRNTQVRTKRDSFDTYQKIIANMSYDCGR